MKEYLYSLLICFIILSGSLTAQEKSKNKNKMLISVGMGIDYGSTPSYTDYLKNLLSAGSGDTIKTFSTGVEFFAGFEYRLRSHLALKLDYSYFLRSNRYTFAYYVFDYTIRSHQPYLMIYYVNPDKKFSFKIGAGAGFHFHVLDNNVSPTNSITYSSGGPSFRGEVVFAPKFSEKLETYISGFVFGSTSASLKDGSGNTLKSTNGKEVNLGGYGVGARLGLSFYLN